uniref:Protein kinase domain-containing protein n=1 Tax=Globisporangium ultimum (strain ATCC 200006 / CBS 805.95 / DAOM BR144) TaxID=431595 RepID=K3X536_GLOUD
MTASSSPVTSWSSSGAAMATLIRKKETLAARPNTRMEHVEALDVMLQIAHGHHFLHSNNIARRDISPENVLLGGDNCFKICDFGPSTRAGTKSSERVRKALYMASEVARGSTEYDPVLADVWSLEAVLFLMLTGSPLVSLASDDVPVFQAIRAIGCLGVLWQWEMDHLFPFATIDLLTKILRIESCDRFQNMPEVLKHRQQHDSFCN